MFKIKSYKILIVLVLFWEAFFASLCVSEETASPSRNKVSLSLEQLSALALANNLDIQIAKYDAYIKRNELLDAESIFDTILSMDFSFKDDQKKSSSSLSGTKATTKDYKLGLSKKVPSGTTLGLEFQDKRTSSNSSYASVNPAHDASVKFSLTQPIGKNFFGLIDRGEIEITKLDIASSDYSSLDKIEDSLAEAQKAFWKLAALREQEGAKKEMLEKAEGLYAIHQNKYQIGLIEDPDLFASEANVNIRKNDVLIAQEKTKIANSQLLLKLNEENLELEIYPWDKLSLETEKLDLVSALKEAIEKNREYLKAKNEVSSKNINLSLKKNSLWPQVDIEASFLRNGISQDYQKAWEDISSEDNPELYLGIKFELPLENREAKAAFDSAKLEKAKYLLLLKKAERQILSEISEKVTEVNAALERIITNQDIVLLQQKKLKAEEQRFGFGRSSSDLLIRYQQDLLDAKISLIQSFYEYKCALIDLRLAQDALLDEYWKEEL